MYVILFGKLRLTDLQGKQVGQILNIGWTTGEEILFKQSQNDESGKERMVRV
jgi:hypothetical protein